MNYNLQLLDKNKSQTRVTFCIQSGFSELDYVIAKFYLILAFELVRKDVMKASFTVQQTQR